MSTKSLQLSAQQVAQLKKVHAKQYIAADHPYILGHIHLDDVHMTLYKSNKVVFQGTDIDFYVQAFSPKFVTHAGSDEVGTGDTFGPVTVVACVVDEAAYQKLKDLPILDSKVLTDELILTHAPRLFSVLKHTKLILSNVDYNRVQATHNLNAIKAKLHNQAYVLLSQKTHLPELCVIDQFTPAKNYFAYLKDEAQCFRQLHFETKAESKYFAVACASMMARYLFLQHMDQLEKTFKFTFPKGSSHGIDQALQDFIDRYGYERLNEVAKLHFKNIQNIKVSNS